MLAAAQFGMLKEDLERSLPRSAEIPFDSERKRMTTVHRVPRKSRRRSPSACEASAGQPAGGDSLPRLRCLHQGGLDSCSTSAATCGWKDRSQPLDDAWRERIIAAHDQPCGQNGMRVLGGRLFARSTRFLQTDRAAEVEHDLISRRACSGCSTRRGPKSKTPSQPAVAAGIRPVMITGDHPLTARHIASQVGIADKRAVPDRPGTRRLTAGRVATRR